uniref:RNA binding motif protein 12Bb n=1 Tax=Electrophorus electricus TaxID=8005 RepID=A0AAY5F1C3_ELEEL
MCLISGGKCCCVYFIMAVVIRLQGLRITAGSEDIRNFFTGLRIPDGGVHIIGGDLENSKSEMQKVLEESTRKSETNVKKFYKEGVKRPAADGRPPLLNEDMRIDMRRGDHQNMGKRTSPRSLNDSQSQIGDGVLNAGGLYLNLSGMPFSATKEDVRLFFNGLQIDDVIFLRNHRGMFNGCGLVKFATREDPKEGLKRDRQYIGPRYIRIMCCSEDQWVDAGGSIRLEGAGQRKYLSDRARSRSPIRSQSRSSSPSDDEYCVLYENLSYSIEKRDIKAMLHPVCVKDDQIIIFVDKNSDRTKSAVVVTVYVSPISKEKMVAILESSADSRGDSRRSSRSSERSQKSAYDSERRCLYVRNLPFDVRKVEIMDFFHGFQLSDNTVVLLQDERGAGLGEALVIFQQKKRPITHKVMLKCITLAQTQEFRNEVIGNMPERNVQRNKTKYGNSSFFSRADGPHYGRGNKGPFGHLESPDAYRHGTRGPHYEPPDQQFDGPTCLKLLNLPSQIRIDEIYDFCYGYRVIPGSVSLQCDRSGVPVGSATVVFETHSEAVTAVQELNGRPIGTRKIKVVFV